MTLEDGTQVRRFNNEQDFVDYLNQNEINGISDYGFNIGATSGIAFDQYENQMFLNVPYIYNSDFDAIDEVYFIKPYAIINNVYWYLLSSDNLKGTINDMFNFRNVEGIDAQSICSLMLMPMSMAL